MELDAVLRAIRRKMGETVSVVTLRWPDAGRCVAVVATRPRSPSHGQGPASCGPGWGIVDVTRAEVDHELVEMQREWRKEQAQCPMSVP